MEKYYAIHTLEPNKEERGLLILKVADKKSSMLWYKFGKDRKETLEEVQESDIEKLLDAYGVR